MKKLPIILLFLFPILAHAQLSSFKNIFAPGPPGYYTASQTSFTGITCVHGGSNSTPAFFTLSGTFISNTTTVALSTGAGLQFSTQSGGSYFSTLTFAPFAGGITGQPEYIYFQAVSSTAAGSYTDTITISSTSATTLIIPVTWTVTTGASLSVNPTAVYPTSIAGTQGSGVSYTVIGAGLGSNNATVPIPPTGYVQSLDDATWVSTAITLTPSAGSLNVPIWIALTAANTAGTNDVTQTITDAGAGVSGATETINGTTSASSTATMFYFSRTAYTAPAVSGQTNVNIYGDPYYAVLTGSANGYTMSTTSTSNWQATGSPLIASSDSAGMLGSSFAEAPDPMLYHCMFQVSTSGGRLADSIHQMPTTALPSQLKQQLTLSGCTVGVARTISMYSTVNTRYTFIDSVKARAIGNTTFTADSAVNLKGNTSATVKTSFTIYPNSSGIIMMWICTDKSPSNFDDICAVRVQ